MCAVQLCIMTIETFSLNRVYSDYLNIAQIISPIQISLFENNKKSPLS